MYAIQRLTLGEQDKEFIESRDTKEEAVAEVKRLNKKAGDNSYSCEPM